MRAGLGFDVHRLDPSRTLVLGGVRIEGWPGLAGHSDADVVCHAIADALLGAAALGDLGSHFPDTDPKWRDASSVELLRQVGALLSGHGYETVSVDATVLLEEPKIAGHVPGMRANIAGALGMQPGGVSVKATTTEGLGTVGRKEGAACMAVVVIGPSA